MNKKTRPCTFRLRVRSIGLTDTFSGTFHCWGTKIYEDHNGMHETTIAVVEGTDGQVHEVEPEHVLFTDKK